MQAHEPHNLSVICQSVSTALAEDIGQGDVSAALCDPDNVSAKVICRETATLCGQAWFNETFKQIDTDVHIRCRWRSYAPGK